MKSADVVVIGGGIAGGAVSFALAQRGLAVVVLESQQAYRDRVRGEVLMPWGVAEAMNLGLEQVLVDAGGCYGTRAVLYDEVVAPEEAESQAVALDRLLPGVPGVLDVGHPQACEAMSHAATAAGADVIRGVSNVKISLGRVPEVCYQLNRQEHVISSRLVIGADGRRSIVREQARVGLEQSMPRTRAAGLLVDGLIDWPQSQVSMGTEGDLHYFTLPRPEGRARLYLLWDARDKNRFRGPGGTAEFLRSFGRLTCVPLREKVAASRPAGPCASYPMNDSWCDRICVDGLVLVGDAAGWNDPIIGQGLSISLRDARIVSQILGSGSDWSPSAFSPYQQERVERMRRLRITAAVITELRCTFGPEGARRRKRWMERSAEDRSLVTPYIAYLRGPDSLPAVVFEPEHVQRILSSN
jgi:2-polyprenyl-6-methoxyphenol hydroxylase-like FAD-dependent oxidoreductase